LGTGGWLSHQGGRGVVPLGQKKKSIRSYCFLAKKKPGTPRLLGTVVFVGGGEARDFVFFVLGVEKKISASRVQGGAQGVWVL